MLTIAAAFLFSVYTDPFTDQRTYRASKGDIERGPGLSFQCTYDRKQQWSVRIVSRDRLEPEHFDAGMMMVRFDHGEVQRLLVTYTSETARINGRDAQQFIEAAGSASKVTLGLRGPDARRIDMTVPLTGAKSAVEQVRRLCAPRT